VHDLPDYDEPQPGTRLPVVGAVLGGVQPLEHVGQVVGRNARAVIVYTKFDAPDIVGQLDVQSGAGVAQPVLHQVGHHLGAAVDVQQGHGPVVGNRDLQADSGLQGGRREAVDLAGRPFGFQPQGGR
ncbi:uncharacterized protein METZ01_LOCUS6864, partial [marine metagenome]